MPAANGQLFSFYLTALRDMGHALSVDARKVESARPLRESLYRVLGTFAVGRGLLLTFEPTLGQLIPAAAKGLRIRPNPLLFNPTRRELKALAKGGRPFHPHIPPGGLERLADRLQPFLERTSFQWIIPLGTGTVFIGILLLGSRVSGAPMTGLELEVLEEMASVLALRIEDARARRQLDAQVRQLQKQSRQLKQIYLETVRALADVIDGPEQDGRPGHSARVAALAAEIGRRLRLPAQSCERLYLAGLLHDIGKQIINREVLEKRAPLRAEERRAVESHAEVGCDLLSHLKFPWGDVATIIRHHHERLDGSGYPDRLRGSEISLEAKILMMAEAFDSMTSDQPWRPRLALEKIAEQISRNLGIQFEPKVVQALCDAVAQGLDGHARSADFVPHLEAGFDPALIRDMLTELRKQIDRPTHRPSAVVIDAITGAP